MIFNLILQGFFSLFETFFSILPDLNLPSFNPVMDATSGFINILFGVVSVFKYISGTGLFLSVLFGVLLIAYPAMYLIRLIFFVLSKTHITGGK